MDRESALTSARYSRHAMQKFPWRSFLRLELRSTWDSASRKATRKEPNAMLPRLEVQLFVMAWQAGEATLASVPSAAEVNHQWPMTPDTVVATVFLTVCERKHRARWRKPSRGDRALAREASVAASGRAPGACGSERGCVLEPEQRQRECSR